MNLLFLGGRGNFFLGSNFFRRVTSTIIDENNFPRPITSYAKMRARSSVTSTKKDRQTDAHPVTQEKKLVYLTFLC